ncbi:MAG: STAS domain-containing protein [Spirochaetes bacterium]|nr:STAS domain-containing protein [Spirochaetota bacterium]
MNNQKVEHKFINNVPVISIEGDMTSETDHEILNALKEIQNITDSPKLIINFEKTNYINSAGIATLINIIQTIGESKAQIVFVALTPHFKKVMEIVGILDFVRQTETDDEAVSLLLSI